MRTSYTPLVKVWDVGVRASGIARGLRRYIARLPLRVPSAPRILEVGCGTGAVTFALLDRYPKARIVATDIDPRMLTQARRIARERKISGVSFGHADASAPSLVRFGSRRRRLRAESFDLVVASAVLEHTNIRRSVPALVHMLAPGGQLIIIGMAENLVGRMYGHIYGCHPIPSTRVLALLREHGCTARRMPLRTSEFSANLSRGGIVARKKSRAK